MYDSTGTFAVGFIPYIGTKSAAINYAKKWWNGLNPEFTFDTANNDCANFVSQCLYEGGIMVSSDWYYWNFWFFGWHKIKVTDIWGTASALYKKIKQLASSSSKSSFSNFTIIHSQKELIKAIKSGKYPEGSVAFILNSDGTAHHAMYIGKSTSDNIFYWAHTCERNGYDTSTRYGLKQIIAGGENVAIFSVITYFEVNITMLKKENLLFFVACTIIIILI